jgi:mono/diheme cytochrome c family protein
MLREVLLAGGSLVVLASALLGVAAGGVTAAEVVATSTAPARTPQLAEGYQLYRLWCVSCHGDDFRGLTPEWIAKWPATHQNCWVAKCHGSNPPPDGFTIPKTAPAIAGPGALLRFRTATAFQAYIRAVMPFQEPGVLEDDQYWAITAYVLENHGIQLPPGELSAENARDIVVSDSAAMPSDDSAPPPDVIGSSHPQDAPAGNTTGLFVAVAAVAVGLLLGSFVLRRRARPPRV